MEQFARVVLGYHGCNTAESIEFARQLFDGTVTPSDWKPSANDYDWLGQGVYFWEHGPQRAREWAGESGTVVGAVIQLGRCFDLTDVRDTHLLKAGYESVSTLYNEHGWVLPKNEGREMKLRKLDCLVINQFMDDMDREIVRGGYREFRYQTVRCSFEEGDELSWFDAENPNAHSNFSPRSQLHSRSLSPEHLIARTTMNKQDLVRKSYEALENAAKRPANERLQSLIDKGLINEHGEVLLWDAFLAVIAVNPGTNGNPIQYFRCLKSMKGMPGMGEIDVSRDSLIQYVKEGKRVITAYLNEKQNRWKEGEAIHLTSNGYLRTDTNEDEKDNLGTLPEFQTIRSGL
jgi:Protein of unknown function (DUF3892)